MRSGLPRRTPEHTQRSGQSRGKVVGALWAKRKRDESRSPGTPFEIEELALQFSSSEAHIRRLVKRLWRQGHITEEIREVAANNGRGGRSRKKVFVCLESDDQVIKTQAGQGSLSPDHDLSKKDQVTKSAQNQGSLSLDHRLPHTGDSLATASMPLNVGDWVEILTGYFAGRHVEVIGFPREKPGWVDVKGNWAITHQYQQSDLRLIRRAQV
jgi:hypothetical protein